MANANDALKNAGNDDRRTRLIGVYLLYIAGLLVVVGVAFGIFMYLMSSMMGAGAGPSDPNEPTRFVRNSMIVSGLVVALGLIVGGTGLYRIRNPIKIGTRE